MKPPLIWGLQLSGDSMLPFLLAGLLQFTAPSMQAAGCNASPYPILGELVVLVLKLRGQAPAYRPGCEDSAPCWDSVRVQTRPDTVYAVATYPGQHFSLTLPSGQYVALAKNGRGYSCWSKIGVIP